MWLVKYCLHLHMSNKETNNTMKAFRKVTIEVKEIRESLKNAGIKTVQLRAYKGGFLVCISDVEGASEKFISFCKENSLKQNPLKDNVIDMGGIKGDFRDFGRIYKYTEV